MQAVSAWHFQFLTSFPCPASWARTAFTSASRGCRPRPWATHGRQWQWPWQWHPGLAEARGDGIIIAGVITTWGGRCPHSIGAAVAEAVAGEAEEARMTVAQRITTLQMWPPGAAAAGSSCGKRSRSNSLCTSSGEGKRQWVMYYCKCKDACNPTTVVAAADGNKDDDKNDSDDDNDRRTSSALISL